MGWKLLLAALARAQDLWQVWAGRVDGHRVRQADPCDSAAALTDLGLAPAVSRDGAFKSSDAPEVHQSRLLHGLSEPSLALLHQQRDQLRRLETPTFATLLGIPVAELHLLR